MRALFRDCALGSEKGGPARFEEQTKADIVQRGKGRYSSTSKRDREEWRGEERAHENGRFVCALQEVVRGAARDMRLAPSRCRVELEERVLQVLVDLHDGRLVATAVAVVGSAEDGDYVLVVAPVVPVHHQLMCARHKRQTVVVVVLLGNVLSECVASTAGRYAPPATIVWV